jgi:hypothetical protein
MATFTTTQNTVKFTDTDGEVTFTATRPAVTFTAAYQSVTGGGGSTEVFRSDVYVSQPLVDVGASITDGVLTWPDMAESPTGYRIMFDDSGLGADRGIWVALDDPGNPGFTDGTFTFAPENEQPYATVDNSGLLASFGLNLLTYQLTTGVVLNLGGPWGFFPSSAYIPADNNDWADPDPETFSAALDTLAAERDLTLFGIVTGDVDIDTFAAGAEQVPGARFAIGVPMLMSAPQASFPGGTVTGGVPGIYESDGTNLTILPGRWERAAARADLVTFTGIVVDGTGGDLPRMPPSTGTVLPIDSTPTLVMFGVDSQTLFVSPPDGLGNLTDTVATVQDFMNEVDALSLGGALSDATPADLGTAAPGVATDASRSDHVHDLPSATDVGAQPADSDLTTIAGLTATTDSFIQAKSGAWSARTIAQVQADLGVPTNYVVPRIVGEWYSTRGPLTTAVIGGTNATTGRLQVIPVYLHAGTLDRIGVYTTAAGAGTTWRLGIYPSGSNGLPDGQTVLLDAGTVNMGATAGLLAITISQSIATAGLYWLACLSDAYSANPTVHAWNAQSMPIPELQGTPTFFAATPERSGWMRTLTGVTTGAIPATCPTMLWGNSAPKIAVRTA